MKDEDSSEGNFPLHAPPASSGVLHLAPIDEQRANKEAALQMAGLSPASSSFLPTSIAKRGFATPEGALESDARMGTALDSAMQPAPSSSIGGYPRSDAASRARRNELLVQAHS